MREDFVVYGSYGYTGRLIVEEALSRGYRPLLSGRDINKLEEQSQEYDLSYISCSLADAARLRKVVARAPVVLHAAGPFEHTSRQMADACLAVGTHYLDITGEISVFEQLSARNLKAKSAGVMLLPGAGFDVVPTDSLAAHLKKRLPSATTLELAFVTRGAGVSRGTALTMIEKIGAGGAVRRHGRIVKVPAGWQTIEVDMGTDRDPIEVTSIPWGDIATSWFSTGIPNVTVYTRIAPSLRRLMKASRILGPVLASGPAQSFLKGRIHAGPAGPSEEARATAESRIWGRVSDSKGNVAVSRMRTPDGYTFTARAAVAMVIEVLNGNAPVGFQTPATAYGPDWVLGIEGIEREDVDMSSGDQH